MTRVSAKQRNIWDYFRNQEQRKKEIKISVTENRYRKMSTWWCMGIDPTKAVPKSSKHLAKRWKSTKIWRLRVSLTTHKLIRILRVRLRCIIYMRIVPDDAPFSPEHGDVNSIDLGRLSKSIRKECSARETHSLCQSQQTRIWTRTSGVLVQCSTHWANVL